MSEPINESERLVAPDRFQRAPVVTEPILSPELLEALRAYVLAESHEFRMQGECDVAWAKVEAANWRVWK